MLSVFTASLAFATDEDLDQLRPRLPDDSPIEPPQRTKGPVDEVLVSLVGLGVLAGAQYSCRLVR
ncbi:hypothetical protein CXR25_13975 [Brevibacterium aurantiacum]|nr:hypothetical protein CXR25_13975 [Brevibacterium aurantiacum]